MKSTQSYLSYGDIVLIIIVLLSTGISIISLSMKSELVHMLSLSLIGILILIKTYKVNVKHHNQLQPENSIPLKKSYTKQVLNSLGALIRSSIQTSILLLVFYFVTVMFAVKLEPSLSSGAGGILGFIIVPGLIVLIILYLVYELITHFFSWIFKTIFKK